MIIVLLPGLIWACTGDDGGSSDASTPDADGGDRVTFEEFLAGACLLSGGCSGIPEYSACVQIECDAALRQCVGEGYRAQDFSGSPCAPYYECVLRSGNLCANECAPDDSCVSCATDILRPCVTSSSCVQPACDGR